jgi:RNA polymerase sigma-70 factor, ECF subfamily
MQRAPIGSAIGSAIGAAPSEASVESPKDLDEQVAAAFRRYSRYVAAVALRLIGRDDELDDVVQEVFLAALRGLPRLREAEAVKGWLATVTVRVAGRRLRRRRLRALLGLDQEADYERLAAPDAPADERALVSRVYRALDAQPVRERLAFCLRHIEGEPLDRVAELCGCSLATAKRRIAAVQARLADELGDEP